MQLVRNPRKLGAGEPLPPAAQLLNEDAANAVLRLLAHCPIYAPTPLLHLPALADELGIGEIHLKDESSRLGLGSFKALGGVYATAELVRQAAARALEQSVSAQDLLTDRVRRIAGEMTFVCASDGNHGRSVAAGARLFGARCVVFLHAGVSAARRGLIAALGARMEIVSGGYDHSVETARMAAARHGWILVSDTSQNGAEAVPAMIMRGYTVVIKEAVEQLGRAPTHVFVQAGVGGLAAAVAGYCACRFAEDAPMIVTIEPERANCLLESCRAGHLVEVPRHESTIYAMLECLRPSRPAWDVLDACCDYFMDVADSLAAPAMRRLRYPAGGDAGIVCGESGVAGLAGLVAGCENKSWRQRLGLSQNSVVLLIGTEGATDPALYERMTNPRLPAGSIGTSA